ncbi:DUF2306 domain-containing protein [Allorhodopirellula solitaria]|uniref:DUF2306 domain-containing protein n=1 Tax=Allorhodopirellula solitaria TaxID=2527987 RepID=A0A5C5XS50_9BACT|nr:DUF2306 domain-containing protein [Allorhodopirellula solitaria]TWT64562.1 hypothetical protein CA85_36950 [Allorhodopirellula solitaria]
MSDTIASLPPPHQPMARLRRPRPRTILLLALALVAAKVFVTILVEYRFYFPADFQSTFLHGREATFAGLYAIAFYTHLIVAPTTLLLAVLLVTTGRKPNPAASKWHRVAGRVQFGLVVFLLVPSGLVMATHALAGPVAAVGLVCLSLATGLSVAAAAVTAIGGHLRSHRRWAIRSAILLGSPLLLRFATGAAFVIQRDTPGFYRLNAWASWLLPLACYEVWCYYHGHASKLPWSLSKFVSPRRYRHGSPHLD